MDYAQGYRDGFEAGYARGFRDREIDSMTAAIPGKDLAINNGSPKKRKVSAYARAYGRAYKSLRRKHTLKSGKLRKGYTHKRLVKLAHAEAKRRRKK